MPATTPPHAKPDPARTNDFRQDHELGRGEEMNGSSPRRSRPIRSCRSCPAYPLRRCRSRMHSGVTRSWCTPAPARRRRMPIARRSGRSGRRRRNALPEQISDGSTLAALPGSTGHSSTTARPHRGTASNRRVEVHPRGPARVRPGCRGRPPRCLASRGRSRRASPQPRHGRNRRRTAPPATRQQERRRPDQSASRLASFGRPPRQPMSGVRRARRADEPVPPGRTRHDDHQDRVHSSAAGVVRRRRRLQLREVSAGGGRYAVGCLVVGVMVLGPVERAEDLRCAAAGPPGCMDVGVGVMGDRGAAVGRDWSWRQSPLSP